MASKYDPFFEEIAAYVKDGLTCEKIAEKIEDRVDNPMPSGMSWWMRSRGINTRVTQGARGKRNAEIPHCAGCGHYDIYKNNTGTGTYRLCHAAGRIMTGNVPTSPLWCPEREKDGFRTESD